MNVARMAVLGVAVVAAGAAALVVRGGIGGPARPAAATSSLAATEEVLVAAREISPGHTLDPALVRWEAWPKSAVSPSFITRAKQPEIGKAVAGAVVRAPLVSGQPVSDANVVHSGATGFMAATLGTGMRAIGVPVTPESTAGGFILPNDRVDVVLTRDMSAGTGAKNFHSETVLKDVRVLAIDQTLQQDKDKQTVLGKTATLELMPEQAELLAQAQLSGVLSLALRGIGDSEGMPVTVVQPVRKPLLAPRIASTAPAPARDAVVVYRYGVLQSPGGASGAAGGNNAAAAVGQGALSQIPGALGALP